MENRIPLVTVKNLEDTEKILSKIRANGLNTAEITFRSACALDAIKLGLKLFPDMNIGAGTVINSEQCRKAIEAGAKFIVSPGLSREVAEICRKHKIDYFPGCVTPTEIMAALELNINVVKFFPASIYGGVKAIKALGGPFPQVKFIPTGGVSKENEGEYLALKNVFAVGGSYLAE